MEFDIAKLEKLSLSRKSKSNIDLTEEEITFMSNIYNMIINSENYDSVIKYLAGVNGMSTSDIEFIRNVYYYYFADIEEKKIYNDKIKKIKKENRRRGFIDISAMISIIIFIGVVGITLAYLLYNLL